MLIWYLASMKRMLLLAVVLSIIACSKTTYTPMPTGPNTLDAAERALGWELLFDGNSLDKWKSYGHDDIKGWAIKDGELVTLGNQEHAIDLMTKEVYKDFELRLEWKLPPGGNSNSGVMYNVKEEKGKAPWMTGPEYQIIDDKGFDPPLETWQKTGANYAMHPPAIEASFPTGQYNSTRIIVDGGYVQHWLNDKLVVKYQLWTEDWEQRKKSGKWKDYPDYGTQASGHIVLQDHDSPVNFRNIKIRRL